MLYISIVKGQHEHKLKDTSPAGTENSKKSDEKSLAQTSANRGPDSTFVEEANNTRSSPKPSISRVIKLMDRNRVTQP